MDTKRNNGLLPHYNTHHAYIEEYLISQGFVLRTPFHNYRIWVDCTSNGRDIRYLLTDIEDKELPYSTDDPANTDFGRPRGAYAVLDRERTHGVYGIYKLCRWIGQAVYVSRDNGRHRA